MRAAVESLTRDWPAHPATVRAAGRLRRRDAVGKPFWISGELAGGGTTLDTRSLLGRPLIVVVWSVDCDRSRTRIREIETFRVTHPDVAVVGVSRDADADRVQQACRELGLAWPQLQDGRGPAAQVMLDWGVDETPFVFVVDAGGALRGATADDAWRDGARAAVDRR